MTATICLRLYSIYVSDAKDRLGKKINYKEIPGLENFIDDFIQDGLSAKADSRAERSWYFEIKNSNNDDRNQGYVHYGTYGFESKLKNRKSNEYVYSRSIDDVEEVPLFYDFWMPDDQNVLASFQTFQGRSCVRLVSQDLHEWFSERFKGFKIHIRKIVPYQMKGTSFFDAPVKKIKLINRSASSDITDNYTGGSVEDVNIELCITAKKKGSFGPLRSLTDRFQVAQTKLLTFGDMEFNEVSAEVNIGGRPRRVGVIGCNNDSGLIDISQSVDRAPNGHPVFDSVRLQSLEILEDIFSVIGDEK